MIKKMRAYPLYQVTDIPWLPRVPAQWTLRRVKHVLQERSEKGFPDEPLLAATQTRGVVRKDQYENRTVEALKDLHLLKLVRVGDFVISLRSFQGGIEFAREQGIISPAYTVLFPRDRSQHGYLAGLFKSKAFIEGLSLYVTGIRQGQNVDYERLSRSHIPIPPADEQAAIVRFLDFADRRIRRYIRAKQKTIELIAKRRQALTQDVLRSATQAVRIGTVTRIIERPVKRVADQIYLPVGLYNRGRGVFHKAPTSGAELGDSDFCWVAKGDLILSGQFAWEGAVAIASGVDDGCIASHRYPILRGEEDSLDSAFLWAYFRTDWGQLLLDVHSRGAAGRNRPLNVKSLLKEKIPVPSLSAQAQITSLIHAESRLLRALAHQLELLREFRDRLTVDVVTGKLDVREIVADWTNETTDPDALAEREALSNLDELEQELGVAEEFEEVVG